MRLPFFSHDRGSLSKIVNIPERRKKIKQLETIVDGYSGFIMLDKNDRPKVGFLHIENEMRWAMK